MDSYVILETCDHDHSVYVTTSATVARQRLYDCAVENEIEDCDFAEVMNGEVISFKEGDYRVELLTATDLDEPKAVNRG